MRPSRRPIRPSWRRAPAPCGRATPCRGGGAAPPRPRRAARASAAASRSGAGVAPRRAAGAAAAAAAVRSTARPPRQRQAAPGAPESPRRPRRASSSAAWRAWTLRPRGLRSRRPGGLLLAAARSPRPPTGWRSSPARGAPPRGGRHRASVPPARAAGSPARPRSARVRRPGWAAPGHAGGAARPALPGASGVAAGAAGNGCALLAHLDLHFLGPAMAEALAHRPGVHRTAQLQPACRAQRKPPLAPRPDRYSRSFTRPFDRTAARRAPGCSPLHPSWPSRPTGNVSANKPSANRPGATATCTRWSRPNTAPRAAAESGRTTATAGPPT